MSNIDKEENAVEVEKEKVRRKTTENIVLNSEKQPLALFVSANTKED